MAISTAIGLERISRVVGYKLIPANFSTDTPYLPIRIAMLGEANTANQATITKDEPFEFISADEVADEFGYGSPLHIMARILRPVSGSLLGGIPTIIYPQESAVGATAAVLKMGVAVATTVTENVTHELIINGRNNIDGKRYSYSLIKGENQSQVTAKIIAAVNAVIAAPVTAASATLDIEYTSKWEGATAILDIEVNTNNTAAGVIYSEVSNTAGTTAVTLTDTLANFGENWNNIVINPYADQLAVLEAFNGKPDPDNPTGRFAPESFTPFVALFGSLLSDKDDIVAITNATARTTEVTNVICPAPNSKGFAFEAAANMAASYGSIAQNSPHIDNSGKYYPDMPVPSDELIGDFSDYDARDFMVKKGSSTVNITNGLYTIQDFITTYVPSGVAVPKFRFVKDLIIDFNMEFAWRIIMERDIQDKTIIAAGSVTTVTNTISTSQVTQLINSHIDLAVSRALIVDDAFSKASIQVGINTDNPARLDIFFRYKRSSTAHIVSSDVEVDFNYTT